MNQKEVLIEVCHGAAGWEATGTLTYESSCEVTDNTGRLGVDKDIYARWEWKEGKLRVQTCFSGVVPLYYSLTANRLVISTSLSVVVKCIDRRNLDEDALSVFLRLGYFISDSTPFQFIKVFGPSTNFTFPCGQLPATRYKLPIRREISMSDARQRYIELFHQSMASRLPVDERFAMPITGGRDSRHILLELLRLNRRPEVLYTSEVFPPRVTNDIEIGKAVAKQCGLPHVVIPSPRRRLPAEIANIKATDYCADEHSWAVNIPVYLGQGYRRGHDGINGGILFGRIGSPRRTALAAAVRTEELAEDMIRESAVPGDLL